MILTVKPASLEEAIWLSSRLRPEDQREVEAATGNSPEAVLKEAFEIATECYTIRLNDEIRPVAIFGVSASYTYPMTAVPWLLATPDIMRGSIALLREAPKWLTAWAQTYGMLYNIVDSRNQFHLRWLVAAGCRLGNYAVEINGHKFIPFFYN